MGLYTNNSGMGLYNGIYNGMGLYDYNGIKKKTIIMGWDYIMGYIMGWDYIPIIEVIIPIIVVIYGHMMGYIYIYIHYWLVVEHCPSEKCWSWSVGMMTFPIYGKMFQTTNQIMI